MKHAKVNTYSTFELQLLLLALALTTDEMVPVEKSFKQQLGSFFCCTYAQLNVNMLVSCLL